MKVIVNKTCATVSGAEMLTSGMVGKTIDVEFSADWLGLIKIAVFTNGAVTRDVLDPNGAVIIPWEVLVKSNKRVSVGFYGYRIENGEKVLAIPTVWAELGAIRAGADPSGDPSAELSPTVAEQLQADVNDLDERVTEIEEHGGGGGGTDFDIHALTAENAIADADELPFYDVSVSAPRKTTWQNIKAKLKTYFDTLYLGASALVGYATQAWVEGNGYLTEHQSLAAYRTAAAQDIIDNGKADKITGKGLSTNDYTDADKAKVASAVQPSDLNDYMPKILGDLDGGHIIADSDYIPLAEAPDGDAQKVNVEAFKMYINKGMASQSDLDDYALKTDLDDYAKTEDVPTKLSQLTGDSTHRVVTDTEKAAWNGKQDTIDASHKLPYTYLSGTPTIPTVPTDVSAFTNDANYLTLATLPIYNGGVS